MALSPATERETLHGRHYEFGGYRRSDGLWDIEGRIVDTKGYTFKNHDRGAIPPGEALHDMEVRLTLDDDFVIQEIEATTNAGPFHICPAIGPNYRKLIGHRMGKGWRRTLREVVGGTEGCTHITEMLGAMATVAFQTIFPILAKEGKLPQETGRPGLLNTCHAFATDSAVVRREWPDYYTGERERKGPESA